MNEPSITSIFGVPRRFETNVYAQKSVSPTVEPTGTRKFRAALKTTIKQSSLSERAHHAL